MDDINRIIKPWENLGIMIDGVSETVKHEIKKQEGRFLGTSMETLGASMLGNMLTARKYVNWKRCGKRRKRCCKSRKRI